MSRQRILWHEAKDKLSAHQRAAAVFGAVWIIFLLLRTLFGCAAEQYLRGAGWLSQTSFCGSGAGIWDVFAVCWTLSSLLLSVPLQTMSMWWLGETVGVLNASDCGFLSCSSRLWLWRRVLRVRLMFSLMLGISVLPSGILFCLSARMLQSTVGLYDGTWGLLLTAHCLLAAILMLWLPLRLLAAQTALPLCYLKSPHFRPFTIIMQAIAATRGETFGLLMRRLCCVPLLICPMTALVTLPTMLTAEFLTAHRRLCRILGEK